MTVTQSEALSLHDSSVSRHLYVAFREPLGARNIMRKVRTVRLRKRDLHNLLIYDFISAGTSAFRRRFVALTDGRACVLLGAVNETVLAEVYRAEMPSSQLLRGWMQNSG